MIKLLGAEAFLLLKLAGLLTPSFAASTAGLNDASRPTSNAGRVLVLAQLLIVLGAGLAAEWGQIIDLKRPLGVFPYTGVTSFCYVWMCL